MPEFTTRSRFTLRVAAAITGDDPWACGYAEYTSTARRLLADLPRIRRDHGGNIVAVVYHGGKRISGDAERFLCDIAA